MVLTSPSGWAMTSSSATAVATIPASMITCEWVDALQAKRPGFSEEALACAAISAKKGAADAASSSPRRCRSRPTRSQQQNGTPQCPVPAQILQQKVRNLRHREDKYQIGKEFDREESMLIRAFVPHHWTSNIHLLQPRPTLFPDQSASPEMYIRLRFKWCTRLDRFPSLMRIVPVNRLEGSQSNRSLREDDPCKRLVLFVTPLPDPVSLDAPLYARRPCSVWER